LRAAARAPGAKAPVAAGRLLRYSHHRSRETRRQCGPAHRPVPDPGLLVADCGDEITVGFSLFEFWGGLALMLAASSRLPGAVDLLARRLHARGGHVGLLMALGANSPEITAGVTGLASGAHEAGYGVVVGSNLVNLAGLLGIGAVVAGSVDLRRSALVLHGGVSAVVTVAALALLDGWIPPGAAATLIAIVFAPYVVLLGLSPATLARVPGGRLLGTAVAAEERAGEAQEQESRRDDTRARPSRRDVAVSLAPALAAVVLGGIAVMRGTLELAPRLAVSSYVAGVLLLAILTGLPNLYTALELARGGRGRAVVSEALNSNPLNLIVGVTLPALVVGTTRAGARVVHAGDWLLASTALALALIGRGRGLGRRGGAALVVCYFAFAAAVLAGVV